MSLISVCLDIVRKPLTSSTVYVVHSAVGPRADSILEHTRNVRDVHSVVESES